MNAAATLGQLRWSRSFIHTSAMPNSRVTFTTTASPESRFTALYALPNPPRPRIRPSFRSSGARALRKKPRSISARA